MPTKLNHAGNQQNYVPAGHGDVSGEYGDNDTGSNIHIQFKKFEKPKDEQKTSNQNLDNVDIKEENKDTEEKKIQTKKDNFKYVTDRGKFNKPTQKALEEIIDRAEDKCVNLLNNAYSQKEYSFSIGSGMFKIGFNELKCDKSDITGDQEYRNRGAVWFHENGHLLDWSKRDPVTKLPVSSTYKSKKTGLSLNETLKEELNQLTSSEEFTNNIYKEKKQMDDDYVKKAVNLEKYNELKTKVDEFHKKIVKLKDDVSTRLIKGEINYEEYRKEFDKIISIDEAKEALGEDVDNYNKMLDDYRNAKKEAQNDFCKLYATISDAYSSKKSYGFGLGHSERYYRERKENLGAEFFANCFSDKTVKSNRAIEVTKKYFPKSYEVFEEMLEEAFK